MTVHSEKEMDNMSFLTEFGFSTHSNFLESLFRPKLLHITIPASIIGSFIEKIFGLQPIVFIAFIVLLSAELVSGIFASWIEHVPITSRRMKSFLMMLFVWLCVLFILNAFQYQFEGGALEQVFNYLFNAVIVFVNIIYFKSIWENAGRIMDKIEEFNKLSDIFYKKFKKK